jgi:hypothetical protein
MTVIAFPSSPVATAVGAVSGWSALELRIMLESLAPRLDRGEAAGWDVGRTERGDPQLYLLGPSPGEDCMLCFSRLGRLYVLEDGAGRVLAESCNLRLVAERARMWRQRPRIMAPLVLLWCGLRQLLEDRIEPLLIESEELLTHLFPQLVALA